MRKPLDQNFILRFLHLHCFIQIHRFLTNKTVQKQFSAPRFKLFTKIPIKYKGERGLFYSILQTFKSDFITGVIITIIFACLNLVVPQLIKMFMHFMHQHHSQRSDVKASYNFLRTFLVVQVLRIIFGQHSKRLFKEISIKVQSSLAKMLAQKSIKMARQSRERMPHSQIIHMENIDLKLISTLFENMYLAIQAPFTVFVAILMLFYENSSYGIIGIYWFVIIFLIQRQLDEKMTHCNHTKLGLIDQRSKANYELLQHYRQAKMIGWEDVIIEKNNDYFIEQNQDHLKFYQYVSLSDISLLMMPVLVVVTICIYDINQPNPITVQQVYLMLSLLGICSTPMKSFRTLSLNFHDGFFALLRLQQYFNLPDQVEMTMDKTIQPGAIAIAKGTIAVYPNPQYNFQVQVDHHIQLQKGDRLVVLGRVGQGSTSFLSMITGSLKQVRGSICLNSKIAYAPNKYFFTKEKIKDNIMFYDQSIKIQKIKDIVSRLGLKQDLQTLWGLQTHMDDLTEFTTSQIAKIALARCLCQNADIYLFDKPFQSLDIQTAKKFEQILRQMQVQQGKIIIISHESLIKTRPDDQIVIIQNGKTVQYGKFSKLSNDPYSQVKKYIIELHEFKEVQSIEDQQKLRKQKVKSKFQSALSKIKTFNVMKNVLGEKDAPISMAQYLINRSIKQKNQKNKKFIKTTAQQLTNTQIWKYLKKYLTVVSFSETIFILVVIACAELLHIFIHFFIGHLEEQHGSNSYLKFGYMVVIEVVLTVGLSIVLYYQGEISSYLVLIQSNQLYRQSLISLTKKRISWFDQNYVIKTADVFNHDYQQIFIAGHSVLSIYKNVIILLATIEFISSDYLTLFAAFSIIIIIYVVIFYTFHSVNKFIVKRYYEFKYAYVQVLEDSIQGAQIITIHKRQQGLLNRVQQAYKRIASYRIAQGFLSNGISITCDLMSVVLLSAIVSYGMKMKMHNSRYNIALIATTIHLLMNGSQVLKNIVKETINFQSFFKLNLIPFMQIATTSKNIDLGQSQKNIIAKRNFDIVFDKITLHNVGDIHYSKPLSFTIKEGQKVLIYDVADRTRQLLISAFSMNLTILLEPQYQQIDGAITIGGVDIRYMDPKNRKNKIGIITKKNFYMGGTLKQNLAHGKQIDQHQAKKYIKLTKLDQDLIDYQESELNSKIQFEFGKVNHQITKKLALIRVLLNQSRIVIIKDSSSFIGSISISTILEQHNPGCTIIKISNKIQAGFDMNRIIFMKNMIIVQDGNPQVLLKVKNSQVGKLLQECNMQGYIYMNQADNLYTPRKIKRINRKDLHQ